MNETVNFPLKDSKAARYFFIITGLVLIADTIILSFVSNWNLGTILPAVIGAPLLIYGLFKRRVDIWFHTKAGRIVKWIFIGGYLALITIVAVGTALIISGSANEPNRKADAIIVLGGGIRDDQPTFAVQKRLDAAADYYRGNQDAVIVVSGGYGEDKKYSEAYVMEKYLSEEKNIPRSKIILEDKSTSTVENFKYSKEILDEKLGGEYKVAYVTNDFHIYRAGEIAKDAGLDAFGVSAPTPALITPNCYLRESLALVKRAVSD